MTRNSTKWIRGPVGFLDFNRKVETAPGYILEGSGIGARRYTSNTGKAVWSVTHLSSGMQVCLAPRLRDAKRVAVALVRAVPHVGTDSAEAIARWPAETRNRMRDAIVQGASMPRYASCEIIRERAR